jgi:cell wall-associated NlpC family hydrolase
MRHRLFVTSCCLLLSMLMFQCSSLNQLFEPTTPRSGDSSNANSSSTTSQLRKNIVGLALQQQGTRYKYAGESPRTGFDCSGFTHYVFSSFDIDLTRTSRSQESDGKAIKVERVQPGDLIFFRKSRTGSVFHVSLVVDNTREGVIVVHSTSSRGVIRENISTSSYWKSKVWTARDIIN